MASRSSETLERIARIFTLVQNKAGEHLPAARWILAASQTAAAHLQQAEPRPIDLRELQRFLQGEDPELAKFLASLLEGNPQAVIYADLVLEQLCQVEDWHHPAQVVAKPPLEALLVACETRLKASTGHERRRLRAVHRKVERASLLAKKAASRRALGDLPSDG